MPSVCQNLHVCSKSHMRPEPLPTNDARRLLISRYRVPLTNPNLREIFVLLIFITAADGDRPHKNSTTMHHRLCMVCPLQKHPGRHGGQRCVSFLLVQNVFQMVIASQIMAPTGKTPNVIHLCDQAVPADDQMNFKQAASSKECWYMSYCSSMTDT